MFYSGTQGELFIDGVKAAKVRSWSYSTSLGLLDTTTLGDTDTTSIPGIRTSTGSCQLFYYAPSALGGTASSANTLINKLMKAGTDPNSIGVAPEAEKVALRLAVTQGNGSTMYVQGPVHLTSITMTCAVGEIFSADVAFQFNGALREVAL